MSRRWLSDNWPLVLGVVLSVVVLTNLIVSVLTNNGEVHWLTVLSAIIVPAITAFQFGWHFGAERESRW